eukprot:4118513-Amphidinium_carterae.1
MKKAQTDLVAPWKVVQEYTSKTKKKARVEWDAILRTVGLPSRQQAAEDYSRRHKAHDAAKASTKRQWSEQEAKTDWRSHNWKKQKWHADRWDTAWHEDTDWSGGGSADAQGSKETPNWEPYDWSEQLARNKCEEEEEDAARAAQAEKDKKVRADSAGSTKPNRWREISQAPDEDQTWGNWQDDATDSQPEAAEGCPPAPKRGWQ